MSTLCKTHGIIKAPKRINIAFLFFAPMLPDVIFMAAFDSTWQHSVHMPNSSGAAKFTERVLVDRVTVPPVCRVEPKSVI